MQTRGVKNESARLGADRAVECRGLIAWLKECPGLQHFHNGRYMLTCVPLETEYYSRRCTTRSLSPSSKAHKPTTTVPLGQSSCQASRLERKHLTTDLEREEETRLICGP